MFCRESISKWYQHSMAQKYLEGLTESRRSSQRLKFRPCFLVHSIASFPSFFPMFHSLTLVPCSTPLCHSLAPFPYNDSTVYISLFHSLTSFPCSVPSLTQLHSLIFVVLHPLALFPCSIPHSLLLSSVPSISHSMSNKRMIVPCNVVACSEDVKFCEVKKLSSENSME